MREISKIFLLALIFAFLVSGEKAGAINNTQAHATGRQVATSQDNAHTHWIDNLPFSNDNEGTDPAQRSEALAKYKQKLRDYENFAENLPHKTYVDYKGQRHSFKQLIDGIYGIYGFANKANKLKKQAKAEHIELFGQRYSNAQFDFLLRHKVSPIIVNSDTLSPITHYSNRSAISIAFDMNDHEVLLQGEGGQEYHVLWNHSIGDVKLPSNTWGAIYWQG